MAAVYCQFEGIEVFAVCLFLFINKFRSWNWFCSEFSSSCNEFFRFTGSTPRIIHRSLQSKLIQSIQESKIKAKFGQFTEKQMIFSAVNCFWWVVCDKLHLQCCSAVNYPCSKWLLWWIVCCALPVNHTMNIRLDCVCMGEFQTQKLINPVVSKDEDTHKKQLLFHDFSNFWVPSCKKMPQLQTLKKWPNNSVFLQFFIDFSKNFSLIQRVL
jgi:hypothetical protein